jgi:ankyrin repeat protein
MWNGKKQKRMSDILSFPDILASVLQQCETIQALSRFSLLSKAFNHQAMHSESGRQAWLSLASGLTGHDAKAYVAASSDNFHARLKLLVCPWLSVPKKLKNVPIEPMMDPDEMRIALAGQDSIALWHCSNHGSRMAGVFCALPNVEHWKFTGSAGDLMPPPVPPRRTFQLIAAPEQLQLSNQRDCRYSFQCIHKSVLAIIEMPAWDMEQRSGIYFFRNSGGRATKLLRHILIGVIPAQTSMIVRPMEMWMLTEETVLYFGPSCDTLPLTLAGRIDRALWYAGAGKAKTAMRFLLKVGATDINTHCITGHMTVLHMAAFQNQLATAKTLLCAQADPEARDDQDMTCLMIASSLEYPEMIRVLCVEGKADPNARTRHNEAALHIVGHQSNTDQGFTKATVQALLDCLADPNAKDVQGQTPLFSYAILDSPPTVELLCSRGADSMHRNLMGRTPLHALYEVCLNAETATVLVRQFKADINAQDNCGKTPLMLAANTRAFVLIRSMLEDMGANPLLCDHKGRNALWYAKNGKDAPIQARAVIRILERKSVEWEDTL